MVENFPDNTIKIISSQKLQNSTINSHQIINQSYYNDNYNDIPTQQSSVFISYDNILQNSPLPRPHTNYKNITPHSNHKHKTATPLSLTVQSYDNPDSNKINNSINGNTIIPKSTHDNIAHDNIENNTNKINTFSPSPHKAHNISKHSQHRQKNSNDNATVNSNTIQHNTQQKTQLNTQHNISFITPIKIVIPDSNNSEWDVT